MGKNEESTLKGQVSIDEVQPKTGTPTPTEKTPKTVKTVKPSAPAPTGTVSAGTPTPTKAEGLPAHPTEEEFKKATLKQREEHLASKEKEFKAKQASERERVKALKEKLKGEEKPVETSAPAPTVDELSVVDEDMESDYSVNDIPERKKKRRICQKYKIKERQLKSAIEEARKIFVPKLGARLHPRLLVAIIELLEFGDI